MKFLSSFLLLLSLSFSSVSAYSSATPKYADPIFYIKIVGIWILLYSALLVIFKDKIVESHKKTLFLLFTIPVVLATLYLAGHTVYSNSISLTKGPVHWHADYQVWACGERLDLINPTGLKNKIGSPLFHEHNDDRIHVEGVVHAIEDVNLGAFFRVIGGDLDDNLLSFPVEDKGLLTFRNGDTCSHDEEADLAVYVNGQRIQDPDNYMYAQETLVPPGDCIIIEFGSNNAQTTQKICESWAALDWSYENFEEKRGQK